MDVLLINCPNCGGEVPMEEYNFNRTVNCSHCGSPLRVCSSGEVAEYWVPATRDTDNAIPFMCGMKEVLGGLEKKLIILSRDIYYMPYYRVEAGIIQLTGGKPELGNLVTHVPANIYGPSSPVHGVKYNITGRYKEDILLHHPPGGGRVIIPALPQPDPGIIANEAMLKAPDSDFSAPFSSLISTVFYPFLITEYELENERYRLVSDGTTLEPVSFTAPGAVSSPALLTAFTSGILGLFSGIFLRFLLSLTPGRPLGLAIFLPLLYILIKNGSRWMADYLTEGRKVTYNGREFID